MSRTIGSLTVTGVTELQSTLTTDDIDARTATTLLIGKATATKVEIADAAVTTEVQGPLTVDNVDTVTGTTLLLGSSTATKVEIADAAVTTEIQGLLTADDLDTVTATTLLLGKATATKVEIADTGVTTEIQGLLTADDLDTVTATTLLLGKATATKVEIADTSVTTEVQGDLTVLGTFNSQTLQTDTVQTTDATVTTITTVATVSDRTTAINTKIVARRSDSGSESGVYFLKAAFRNNGGTVTQIGGDDKLVFEDTAAWDVTTSISGTNILIRVTGEVAKTIEWKSSVESLQSD